MQACALAGASGYSLALADCIVSRLGYALGLGRPAAVLVPACWARCILGVAWGVIVGVHHLHITDGTSSTLRARARTAAAVSLRSGRRA